MWAGDCKEEVNIEKSLRKTNVMQVLNFCILYAKYYIYIQSLFNNYTLDLYTCLDQLKQALKTEENICKKNNMIIWKKYSSSTTLSMRI